VGSRRRFNSLLAGMLPLALLVAACGDDDDSSGGDESTDTSDPAEELTGEPIRVMQIAQITDAATGTPTPEVLAGAEAAAASINAAGGIDGRPIEVLSCDDMNDTNQAADCARQAVEEGVVATVGNNTAYGDAVNPILEEAGIASIGPNPLAMPDYSSPISFPISPGLPGSSAGTAYWLAQNDAGSIGLGVIDIAGFPPIVKTFADLGIGASGTAATIGDPVPVPVQAPDYAPLAESASDGNDAVMIAFNADQAVRFLQALDAGGFDGLVGGANAMATEDTLDEFPDLYEDVLFVSNYRPLDAGGEGVETFLADMEEYAPDAAMTDFTIQGWLGVQTLKLMIEDQGLTTIDAASVLEGMGTLENLDLFGFVAPYTTVNEFDAFPGLNRLFNQSVWVGHIEGGEFVLDEDQPVNGFQPAG
jgi:branched-chain amino acid transport system substrate-binding protein